MQKESLKKIREPPMGTTLNPSTIENLMIKQELQKNKEQKVKLKLLKILKRVVLEVVQVVPRVAAKKAAKEAAKMMTTRRRKKLTRKLISRKMTTRKRKRRRMKRRKKKRPRNQKQVKRTSDAKRAVTPGLTVMKDSAVVLLRKKVERMSLNLVRRKMPPFISTRRIRTPRRKTGPLPASREPAA